MSENLQCKYPDSFYQLPKTRHIEGTEDDEKILESMFLQLPQSNLIINPVPAYITLNSEDRNRLKWPKTSEFQIKFVESDPGQPNGAAGVVYKNVYSIKLLSCVVPNRNNVLDEAYLLLEIPELEGMYDAASLPSQKAFCKLYFQRAPGPSTFLRLDRGIGDPLTLVYWPTPKAKIDKLTVIFRRYDGTVFDFGSDTGPNPNPNFQTTVTFEIRNYVTDVKKAIGSRNV